VLWFFFAVQLFVFLALAPLGLSLKDALVALLELLPPLLFLMHVLAVVYDKKAFPEYYAAIVSALEKCGVPREGKVLYVVAPVLLLGLWIVALSYFDGLYSALFVGGIGLLAWLLDARKGWMGVKSLSCWFLRRFGLSRSR
jgi:hypothetical protein